jgi:hypothetical protein
MAGLIGKLCFFKEDGNTFMAILGQFIITVNSLNIYASIKYSNYRDRLLYTGKY